MAGFTHSIAGGQGNLVIDSLQSPDFVHGVSGWQVSKNGDAEFNSVQARGSFFLTGAGGSEIAIDLQSGVPVIVLIPESVTHMTANPSVFTFADNAGAANEIMVLAAVSGKSSGQADAGLQLFGESADGTVPPVVVFEFGGAIGATIRPTNATFTGSVQPGNGTTSGAHVYSGSGAPTISGIAGDLYIRSNGGAGSYLYRCTGGTSWTAFA